MYPLKVRPCSPLKVSTCGPLKARTCCPRKVRKCTPLKGRTSSPLKARACSVEVKLHGESKVIQRCFDDKNVITKDDDKDDDK